MVVCVCLLGNSSKIITVTNDQFSSLYIVGGLSSLDVSLVRFLFHYFVFLNFGLFIAPSEFLALNTIINVITRYKLFAYVRMTLQNCTLLYSICLKKIFLILVNRH